MHRTTPLPLQPLPLHYHGHYHGHYPLPPYTAHPLPHCHLPATAYWLLATANRNSQHATSSPPSHCLAPRLPQPQPQHRAFACLPRRPERPSTTISLAACLQPTPRSFVPPSSAAIGHRYACKSPHRSPACPSAGPAFEAASESTRRPPSCRRHHEPRVVCSPLLKAPLPATSDPFPADATPARAVHAAPPRARPVSRPANPSPPPLPRSPRPRAPSPGPPAR